MDDDISSQSNTSFLFIGFVAVTAFYFLYMYITSSQKKDSESETNSHNSHNTTTNPHIYQSTRVETSRKQKVCFVYNPKMSKHELIKVLELLKSKNHEIYFIIKIHTNDVKESNKVLDDFRYLSDISLVKTHVSRFLLIFFSAYALL